MDRKTNRQKDRRQTQILVVRKSNRKLGDRETYRWIEVLLAEATKETKVRKELSNDESNFPSRQRNHNLISLRETFS